MSLFKSIFFVLGVLLISGITMPLSGQNQIFIGSEQEDIAHSLKMFEGKYYIVGTTRKNAKSAKDYFLIQLRSNGSIERRYIFGFPRHDIGNQVIVDNEGIFIFGNAYDWGYSNVDMHLFKINNSEEPEWEQFYGTQYQDMGLNAIRTQDGGFALIGNSNTQSDGGDFYFVKTDKKGNVQWEKLFGPRFVDYGFSLIETNNGNFVLAGTENGFYNPTQTDFVTHDADALLIKTNNAGEQIWYKTFGGNSHDWVKDIIEAPDGGYLVCGSTQSFGAGSFDVLLMKIDEDGNELWKKTFGGPEFEYGEKICLSDDGNLYLTATSASFSDNKKPNHLIIKTDLSGNEIWSKVLGTDDSDYSSGIVATPDSGLVFTGWTKNGEHGKTDIIFYKLSKNGETQVISGLTPTDSVTSMVVFPNPAKDKFTVEIISAFQDEFNFDLFDINGKIIRSKKIKSNQKYQIEVHLKSGIYFYRAGNNSETIHIGKIAIQN